MPTRIRRALLGPPRDLGDRSLFHRLTLIPFLAWVGLGADGLSSAAYGPPEAFAALGAHRYLVVPLALATGLTVLLISAAYSRIIAAFPHGGGGYVVASKLLGRHAGLASGCALVVDYVLTITVSIAAAGDALFSFLPAAWLPAKLPAEVATLALFTLLNARGVRESIVLLVPIFLSFLVTHVPLVLYALFARAATLPALSQQMGHAYRADLHGLGLLGMVALLARAYSLGGGTYTGLEAVSNGLPMMREPRVQTARRTMVYMSVSLAFMAAGLLLCYAIFGAAAEPGKSLNAVLFERVFAGLPFGRALLVVTMITEGALLLVAVQTGFLDGPRVLSNMAADGWVPRRFTSLSERLTTQDGILLMGGASLAALLYTRGHISHLVVMFSINVFLTFSLSMAGMLRRSVREASQRAQIPLFAAGLLLCATVLLVTVYEKFAEGGWLTLVVTASLAALCLAIRRHYRGVTEKLSQLERDVSALPPEPATAPAPLDRRAPTAVVLVGGYGGLGIHTVFSVLRVFPRLYKNLVFVSVGIIDSGEFKGERELEGLRSSTDATLARYVDFARRLGLPAEGRGAVGTDAADEIERLCQQAAKDYPQAVFFAGQVIFKRERWYHSLLHNQTAYAVQKRLQWEGLPLVILPVRVR